MSTKTPGERAYDVIHALQHRHWVGDLMKHLQDEIVTVVAEEGESAREQERARCKRIAQAALQNYQNPWSGHHTSAESAVRHILEQITADGAVGEYEAQAQSELPAAPVKFPLVLRSEVHDRGDHPDPERGLQAEKADVRWSDVYRMCDWPDMRPLHVRDIQQIAQRKHCSFYEYGDNIHRTTDQKIVCNADAVLEG
jgi:hypothetical protein